MSIFLRTDVSAVKLYKDVILAGIGSSLNAFTKTSKKLLQRLLCLKGQKIYGFVPAADGCRILVFGGKQFTVISETCTENTDMMFMRLFESEVCDDWLYSVIWIDNNTAAFLTGHNVVQIWDVSKPSMKEQFRSPENSILYSGLLLPLQQDVLVFAGTVYSEVIVRCCKIEQPLHYLKGHKGVIFSISCDQQNGIIVTTSDDRSVRIWGINNTESLTMYTHNTVEYWQNADIVSKYECYGHTARVMRSFIIQDKVISVGEDSVICFWDLQGKLLKKSTAHQSGGIWSLDANNEHLVTGGGDSAVILHPLTLATESGLNEVLDLEGTPKMIVFTARRNLVILNDKDKLIHYNVENKTQSNHSLKHESTYKLLSVSSCKQIIGIVDMSGNLDIFIENCTQEATLRNIIKTKLEIGKIMSMHWAGNRHLVMSSEDGKITVLASKENNVEVYENFVLPPCKERWLTASAIDSSSTMFIVGDRCGNIHIYANGSKNPIKTFSKVHGRYGPTSITIKNNEFITTGRDGSIKYFSIDKEDETIAKYMSKKDLEFQWVEKFVDKNENIVCGFQERVFVVYDIKNNCTWIEVTCGGGHRSWDVVRYSEKRNDGYEEYVKFMYIKNAEIQTHTFDLNKIKSSNIINGSHFKEINCLKAYKSKLDESVTFCISGGEDTTLRISSINSELYFQDEIVFRHLSSVRTLQTMDLDDNKILLVTGGGRAQICINLVEFFKGENGIIVKNRHLVEYIIKGIDREKKGKQTFRNCPAEFDPETRIMDIDLIKQDENNFLVIAGCSDRYLRFYSFNLVKATLTLANESNLPTCILNTRCFWFMNRHCVGITNTLGDVILIQVTYGDEIKYNPFFIATSNKSGVNSLDIKLIENYGVFYATGGDDNSVRLELLEIHNPLNLLSGCKTCYWSSDKLHCSQVTGVRFLDDLLISTSIDQRVTVCRWHLEKRVITCDFLTQTYSDVADIQGMDVLSRSSDCVKVCVFGKGMEIIEIPIPTTS